MFRHISPAFNASGLCGFMEGPSGFGGRMLQSGRAWQKKGLRDEVDSPRSKKDKKAGGTLVIGGSMENVTAGLVLVVCQGCLAGSARTLENANLHPSI